MNRLASILVLLAFVLLPGLAAAQHDEKPTKDPIKEFCEKNYPDLSLNGCLQTICQLPPNNFTDSQAIGKCADEYKLRRIEMLQEQQAEGIVGMREEQRQILEGVTEIGKKLEALQPSPAPASVTSVTPATSAASIPAPAAPVPEPAAANTTIVDNTAAQVQTAFVGGAPYQLIESPSFVSFYPLLKKMEPDTLLIQDIGQANSRENCGGTSGPTMILITNHGQPVTVIAPLGAPSGSIEVPADLDGDGKPDPLSYFVLDPTFKSHFWVTWRDGDEIQLEYLRPSGRKIPVAGLPLQVMWRRSTAGENPVAACEMDQLEPRGGHRKTFAWTMARVWK